MTLPNSLMTSVSSIDDEWETFMACSKQGSDDDEDLDDVEHDELLDLLSENEEYLSANLAMDLSSDAPPATEIYISTTTKIAYLNMPIDLQLFWDLPVIPYYKPVNGIVKKQIKLTSLTPEELATIQEKIKDEPYFEENVITHIDNPDGRIKFKDVRKISVGISKKDILSYRSKKKSAFYNCFAIILRLKMDGVFKEFHVKVFNTGKLEIPGIQSEAMFQTILSEVIGVLQPHVDVSLYYRPNSDITVLINSNFNCGFFVNREALFDILKMKYNLQAIYDPCSYPGIQCKFYYNPDAPIQHGCQISEDQKHLYKRIKKVSFMVFRTGSVLIVGKCDEYVLLCIYEYLKMLLNNEYKHICQKTALTDKDKHRIEFLTPKVSTKKMRRRTIYVRNSLPRVVESEEEEAMECAC